MLRYVYIDEGHEMEFLFFIDYVKKYSKMKMVRFACIFIRKCKQYRVHESI